MYHQLNVCTYWEGLGQLPSEWGRNRESDAFAIQIEFGLAYDLFFRYFSSSGFSISTRICPSKILILFTNVKTHISMRGYFAEIVTNKACWYHNILKIVLFLVFSLIIIIYPLNGLILEEFFELFRTFDDLGWCNIIQIWCLRAIIS